MANKKLTEAPAVTSPTTDMMIYVVQGGVTKRATVAQLLSLSSGGGSPGSAPTNSSPPAISGISAVGETLTLSNGTWANSPTSYSRQWLRNGTPISGATGATYVLVEADKGTTITGSVTATNASGSSSPSVSSGVGPVEASFYQGLVATRGLTPRTFEGSLKQSMTRMTHRATDDISQLKLAYVGWYASGGEFNAGADATWRASIEYPEGVFTQVLFSGSASGTCPNGGQLISDNCSVSIPEGATFWTRSWQSNSAGIIYRTIGGTGTGSATNQTMVIGATTPDLTMGGAVSGASSITAGPAAIIGMTNKSSIVILADSRGAGSGATVTDTVSGEDGAVRPSLNDIGYIDYSVPGITMAQFLTAAAPKRIALASTAGFSHILAGGGINDIAGAVTGADLVTRMQTVKANWGGKPIVVTTLEPYTTGTFTDLAGQTINSTNPERVNFNTTLRGDVSAWAHGVLEVAAVNESTVEPGKWIPNRTSDGVHDNDAGYAALTAAGVYTSASFTR